MAIDFSNTDFEPEALDEPLVTTSLTREDEGEYSPWTTCSSTAPRGWAKPPSAASSPTRWG